MTSADFGARAIVFRAPAAGGEAPTTLYQADTKYLATVPLHLPRSNN